MNNKIWKNSCYDLCTVMAFSHWKTSDKHVARSYSNRRPVIGWDKFYLPSKETISFVKRDMNINGGI